MTLSNGDKEVLARIDERVEHMKERTLPAIEKQIEHLKVSFVNKDECALVSSEYKHLAKEFGIIKKGVILAIIGALAGAIMTHI